MEACGAILCSPDFKEFRIKCTNCSIESDIKDWEQFLHHVTNSHFYWKEEDSTGSGSSEEPAFIEIIDSDSAEDPSNQDVGANY